LGAGEEFFETAQAFVNAFEGSGVGKAEVSGSTEGFTGDHGHLSLIEQLTGEFGAVLGECWTLRAV
jgi:hypothetical protein